MSRQVKPLEMEGSSPCQTRSADSQRQDNFLNLEQEKDQDKQREGNVNTSHTSRSRSKRKGHASHKRNDRKALQQEIDDLKKKLRRAQRKRPSPCSDTSSDKDDKYRRRSRTPPSETFPMRKSNLVNAATRARHTKAWPTMP